MTGGTALALRGVYRDEGDADAPAVDFVVGRIEGETTVEGEPLLQVAHLQIGPADGGDGVVMSHAPFALATATAAAARKLGEADVHEAFEAGYAAWRTAYDAGEAGVFSIGPAKVYAAMVSFMGASGHRGGGEG